MGGREEDIALIRRWFQRLTDYVQSVDYVGARQLFAENLIAFGTFADFVTGARRLRNSNGATFGAPSTIFAAASTTCIRSFPRTGSPLWA
jgi:hypothetical protein